MQEKLKLVVIGNGMSSHRLLEALVERGAGQFQIQVIGEEPSPAYDRIHLSDYPHTSSLEELLLKPENWYSENGIDLRLNERVLSIDSSNHSLSLESGDEIPFDRLVIATGSRPRIPPIEGLEGVPWLDYRTIQDMERILEQARGEGKRGLVLGGGLLGLEAAGVLLRVGAKAIVVEAAETLLGGQLDGTGGRYLEGSLRRHGVRIHTGAKAIRVGTGEDGAYRMDLESGEQIDFDFLILCAGITPNDGLAREGGIGVEERGGIRVNQSMETDVPGFYAIGECASLNGMTWGLAAPSYRMADVAAGHLLGETVRFSGADTSTRLKFPGVEAAFVGSQMAGFDTIQIQYDNPMDGIFKKFMISWDRMYLMGATMVGDASEFGTLLQYYLNGIPLPPRLESIFFGGEEGVASLIESLPESMVVCHCEGMTRGEIGEKMLDSKVTNWNDFQEETRVGKTCGGCVSLARGIFEYVMKEKR